MPQSKDKKVQRTEMKGRGTNGEKKNRAAGTDELYNQGKEVPAVIKGRRLEVA